MATTATTTTTTATTTTRPEEKKDQKDHQVDEKSGTFEKKEESIYNDAVMDRVIVSIKPMAFYVDRARRALRLNNEITIIGFDNYISSACTVVETLKRQKIAHIKKIETTMDTPLLNTNNFVAFARPVPKITIHLTRGELSLYLSGFYQRKVIEIFENVDKDSNGHLTHDQIIKLDLLKNFHATEEQKQRALKEIHGKTNVTLPEFIRFASHAVHPKLRDDLFKQILQDSYGIHPGFQGDDADNDHTQEHDANDAHNNLNNANNHDDNQ